jgi:MFS transporter, DHA3 family, macrolide efflux protein
MLITDRKKVFLVTWFGQLLSGIGTGLTEFALGVFVFQLTGSTTQFALVMVFAMVPAIVFSPFSGAMADRWDRRQMMLIANVVSAVTLVVLLVLKNQDSLELWHIYLAVGVVAIAGAVRDPAYYASVSQLVPKEQAGRASGMVQTGENAGMIAPPVLAGILIVAIGLPGVLIIDLISYLIGIASLLFVRFPELERGDRAKSSLWRDTVDGWNYMMRYRGFLYLFLFGAFTSFSVGLTQIVVTPMILNGHSPTVLGVVNSAATVGIFLGGLVMAAWGGPKRRVRGVLIFGLAQALALLILSSTASPWLIGAGIFGYLFCIQFVRGCTATIIRTHVPDTMQARVFSLNRFVAWSTLPVAYLAAGPLVNVFEPLLAQGGSLAGSVGSVLGVGPGRGIGFMLMLVGALFVVIVLASYANPRLRNIEDEMLAVEANAEANAEAKAGAEAEVDGPPKETVSQGDRS